MCFIVMFVYSEMIDCLIMWGVPDVTPSNLQRSLLNR